MELVLEYHLVGIFYVYRIGKGGGHELPDLEMIENLIWNDRHSAFLQWRASTIRG